MLNQAVQRPQHRRMVLPQRNLTEPLIEDVVCLLSGRLGIERREQAILSHSPSLQDRLLHIKPAMATTTLAQGSTRPQAEAQL